MHGVGKLTLQYYRGYSIIGFNNYALKPEKKAFTLICNFMYDIFSLIFTGIFFML